MNQEPHKITQKIVAQRVLSEATETKAVVTDDVYKPIHMNETIVRPEVLLGATYKIKIGNMEHALYLTINDIILNEGTDHEERRPYEIFLNSKNMEHFQWVIALTRLTSAVFRKGGDVTFLVEELKQVFDPKDGGMWEKGTMYPSLVAKIGQTIETHMVTIGLIKVQEMTEHQKAIIAEKVEEFKAVHGDSVDESGFPEKAVLCAKCNTKAAVLMDGCMVCLNCGDSKCS